MHITIRIHLLCMIGILASVAGCQYAENDGTPASTNLTTSSHEHSTHVQRSVAALVEQADQLVTLLAAGRFNDAREYFPDRTQQPLTADGLEQMWQKLSVAGGEYQGRGAPYHRREHRHSTTMRWDGPAEEPSDRQAYDTIYMPLHWQHRTAVLRLVFDEEGRVVELYTQPPAQLGDNELQSASRTAQTGDFHSAAPGTPEVRVYDVPTVEWLERFTAESLPHALFNVQTVAVGDCLFVRAGQQEHEAIQSVFDLLTEISEQQVWPDEAALDALTYHFADGSSLRAYLLNVELQSSSQISAIRLIAWVENKPRLIHIGTRLILLHTTEAGHAALRDQLPVLDQAYAEHSRE